jgi:DNA-binding NtrC family response regulator
VHGASLNRYEAVEADSAKTALKAFAESGFDAAVVDIFLKDTNGFDVSAAMREQVPDLPVVSVSGMTTLDAVARSSESPNLICLQKAFRPIELIRAVETARAAARMGEVGIAV